MNNWNISEKTIIKTICDSVNHTRFPKEDHLPDRERRDNKVAKGDRVEGEWWVWKICKDAKLPDSSYDSDISKLSIPSIFYISVHHLFTNQMRIL